MFGLFNKEVALQNPFGFHQVFPERASLVLVKMPRKPHQYVGGMPRHVVKRGNNRSVRFLSNALGRFDKRLTTHPVYEALTRIRESRQETYRELVSEAALNRNPYRCTVTATY